MASPCCFSGHEHSGTPLGRVDTVHGLPTYISDPEGEPKAIIVIISDAFGWDFKNLRILSDIYAKRTGARVYMPDFMDGHAAPPETIYVLDRIMNPAPSWLSVLTSKIPAIFTAITTMIPFLYLTRQSICEPRIRTFFTSLRTSTPSTLRIGAAGFCWGGKYVTLFTHADAVTPSGTPYMDAGFTAHPSNLVVPADIEKVERPYSISVGDVDMAFSLAQINQTKEILDKKEGAEERFEVEVIRGAKHGFSVRGHPEDTKEREQAQEAEDQAVRFFARWLGTKGVEA